MSNESLQRAAVYTTINLGVSALYYLGARERLLPTPILNKQVGVIALSILVQASRGFLIDHEYKDQEDALKCSLIIHISSIISLGIGSYFCNVPLKINLITSLVLGLTYAQTADYLIHKGDPDLSPPKGKKIDPYYPPSFPSPAKTPLEEAYQIFNVMKEGPLKRTAYINIILTKARFKMVAASDLPKFDRYPAHRVSLECGLAEIEQSSDRLEATYQHALLIDDFYLKPACMIRIAYAEKRINPEKTDYQKYLDHCTNQCFEIQNWVKGFQKYDPRALPKRIAAAGEHHMMRCAYHTQEGNIEEALKATREDIWNLFWRIEALCNIAKRQQAMRV